MRARTGRWSDARRAIAWSVVAFLGASLALACASIIGIDDRLPDDVTSEGSVADDREVVPDDHPNVPDLCPPASKCVDVPAGWQLASLAPNQRPGCAAGYGAPEDLVVALDGLGCTCKCTETSPGSCVSAGTTTTFRDYPAAGCSASTSTYVLDVLDGGCTNATIATTPAVRIPTPAAGSPSCAADASPSALKTGQACAAQGMVCNDGGMCAGALPDGELLCVTQSGDVACPAGYEKKYPVGSGTGTDTRKCGSCTCTPGTSCSAPILELFKDAGCTNASAALVVPATGSCTDVDAGVSYESYRFTGKAPTCQPSIPPLLDGGVTIQGLKTVCCPPKN